MSAFSTREKARKPLNQSAFEALTRDSLPTRLGEEPQYIVSNIAWFNATHTVAVGAGWPPRELVIHTEVAPEDRPGVPPVTCRLGSRSEYRARSKYSWKDKALYRALQDIDRSYYIVLVTCDDGRSGCLPLRVPAPDCTPPDDYVCCILSGYVSDL